MTTPQSSPLITLQPLASVSEDRNLLLAPAESTESCCGGGACSV